MKISVFGMGYVGCVSGACLADMGHEVIGVDINPLKVDMINDGRSPIVEERIDDLVREVRDNGRFRAILDSAEAIHSTELAIVCVGTPSLENGNLDTSSLEAVARQIGDAIRTKNDYYVIAVRSTVLPGTVWDIVRPIIEDASGKKIGDGWGLCMNPEFLREGTSVYDFYNPPKIVIGESDERAGEVVAVLHKGLDAPVIRTEISVAEMVKYSDNAFHALKIVFANEIGMICKKHGIDSHRVMDIFVQDTKLNISPKYLRPGFAFGGSCLGKDLRALTYRARMKDLDTPLLSSILSSNDEHIQRIVRQMLKYRGRKIGFLGLSFKEGTDDLRESPLVILAEALIGRGLDVSIYDRYVNVSRLIGRNKDIVEKEMPHLVTAMTDSPEDLIKSSDVIVVGNIDETVLPKLEILGKYKVIIDLVRIPALSAGTDYDGICW